MWQDDGVASGVAASARLRRLKELTRRGCGASPPMAADYTVVLFSRQHVGNAPGLFEVEEPQVAFVGPAREWPFDCPGVDATQAAVLMFQSRDVDHRANVLRINGVDVFGGVPVSPARDAWNGN